jgi:hypothetical protein
MTLKEGTYIPLETTSEILFPTNNSKKHKEVNALFKKAFNSMSDATALLDSNKRWKLLKEDRFLHGWIVIYHNEESVT